VKQSTGISSKRALNEKRYINQGDPGIPRQKDGDKTGMTLNG